MGYIKTKHANQKEIRSTKNVFFSVIVENPYEKKKPHSIIGVEKVRGRPPPSLIYKGKTKIKNHPSIKYSTIHNPFFNF